MSVADSKSFTAFHCIRRINFLFLFSVQMILFAVIISAFHWQSFTFQIIFIHSNFTLSVGFFFSFLIYPFSTLMAIRIRLVCGCRFVRSSFLLFFCFYSSRPFVHIVMPAAMQNWKEKKIFHFKRRARTHTCNEYSFIFGWNLTRTHHDIVRRCRRRREQQKLIKSSNEWRQTKIINKDFDRTEETERMNYRVSEEKKECKESKKKCSFCKHEELRSFHLAFSHARRFLCRFVCCWAFIATTFAHIRTSLIRKLETIESIWMMNRFHYLFKNCKIELK